MENTPPARPGFFSTPRGLLLLSLGVALVLGIEARAFLEVPAPDRAYSVLSTATWAKQGPYTSSNLPYHWLANGDLAYLHKNPNGCLQVCYQKMDANGPIGSVRLGPELPSTAQAGVFHPSPDEQWIAFNQQDKRMRYHTMLLSADGQTLRALGKDGDTFATWLSDSQSYLSHTFKPVMGLKVSHLDSPKTSMIQGANPSDIPETMSTIADGPDFQVGSFFSFNQPSALSTQNRSALMAPSSVTMTIRTFSVSNPDAAPQTRNVTVPPQCEYAGAYISPDRKHLLWFTSSMKPVTASSWINNAFGLHTQTSRYETRCFLSDLNGNNRRPILDVVISHFNGIDPLWTPDGKHVSFTFQDKLYLVPVD